MGLSDSWRPSVCCFHVFSERFQMLLNEMEKQTYFSKAARVILGSWKITGLLSSHLKKNVCKEILQRYEGRKDSPNGTIQWKWKENKKDFLLAFYYKMKAIHWILRSNREPKHCEKFHLRGLKTRELEMHVDLLQIFKGPGGGERRCLIFQRHRDSQDKMK